MDSQFYDDLAPFYHLIHGDWEAATTRQSTNLKSIITEFWGEQTTTILDLTCGIGTQALGLAQIGFKVTASDLSPESVERAKQEALKRGLEIDFSVADMLQAFDHHQRTFDLVIACDNAVPHLLSDSEILVAFRQFYKCTKPGGGCIISVRDYAAMNLGGTQVHPHGIRVEGNARYLVFQVWEFHDSIYDVSIYFVKDEGGAHCTTRVMRSKYYGSTVDKVIAVLGEAGFENVQRVDNRVFQPVIVASKPATSV